MDFLEGDLSLWDDVPWAETWLRNTKLSSKMQKAHRQLQALKHPSTFVGQHIFFADGDRHYYVQITEYMRSGGQGSTLRFVFLFLPLDL